MTSPSPSGPRLAELTVPVPALITDGVARYEQAEMYIREHKIKGSHPMASAIIAWIKNGGAAPWEVR